MSSWCRGLAMASLLLACGCGAEVPPGGGGAMPKVPEGPRIARQVDAADLLPKDLDLVVRVDLARMRAGLGPDATKQSLCARGLAVAERRQGRRGHPRGRRSSAPTWCGSACAWPTSSRAIGW